MGAQGWWQLLLLAAGAHAGLQLVVRLVVYPALADAAAGATPEEAALARAGHERHTGRMAVAVAPVYGLLVVAAAGVLLLGPSALAAAAAAVVGATLAVTGLLAVPAHEAALRAGDATGRAAAHRRLARADRLRLLLAVVLVGLAWAGAR